MGFIKVFIGILLSPLIGLLIAFFLAFLLVRLEKRFPKQCTEKMFKALQLFSSALLSLTHGGNDAQKTMGVIAVLLFSASWLGDTFYVPFWVVISCHLVISLGTLAGGWRIVHVMGTKITHLTPLRGCAAETGAAAIIFVATEGGIPVSTTHTVTGAITGVGLLQGLWGVNVPIIRRIFCSWLLTIPMTGLVSAVIGKCFGLCA
jgi:PiT family inorganic phosphate transporter